jgi:hypothetical protein
MSLFHENGQLKDWGWGWGFFKHFWFLCLNLLAIQKNCREQKKEARKNAKHLMFSLICGS